ncbi:hypothetical protein GCM10009834_47990 [Streptomonospora arabica]
MWDVCYPMILPAAAGRIAGERSLTWTAAPNVPWFANAAGATASHPAPAIAERPRSGAPTRTPGTGRPAGSAVLPRVPIIPVRAPLSEEEGVRHPAHRSARAESECPTRLARPCEVCHVRYARERSLANACHHPFRGLRRTGPPKHPGRKGTATDRSIPHLRNVWKCDT